MVGAGEVVHETQRAVDEPHVGEPGVDEAAPLQQHEPRVAAHQQRGPDRKQHEQQQQGGNAGARLGDDVGERIAEQDADDGDEERQLERAAQRDADRMDAAAARSAPASCRRRRGTRARTARRWEPARRWRSAAGPEAPGCPASIARRAPVPGARRRCGAFGRGRPICARAPPGQPSASGLVRRHDDGVAGREARA